MIRQTHCAACGKLPSNGSRIKEVNIYQFFNLMPLCIKHCHEHSLVGTIEMVKRYVNVKRFIEHKGWNIEKNKLTHKDVKED